VLSDLPHAFESVALNGATAGALQRNEPDTFRPMVSSG